MENIKCFMTLFAPSLPHFFLSQQGGSMKDLNRRLLVSTKSLLIDATGTKNEDERHKTKLSKPLCNRAAAAAAAWRGVCYQGCKCTEINKLSTNKQEKTHNSTNTA